MEARPLRRILLVEDEPDIQAIAGLALRSVGGFEVEVASSGSEALARLGGIPPDLVLLDVMLPGMSGPEVFERLRELPGCAEVPVVFMTAKVQPGEVDGYLAMGAVGLIAKPFDPMGLSQQVLEIWRKVTSPPAG